MRHNTVHRAVWCTECTGQPPSLRQAEVIYTQKALDFMTVVSGFIAALLLA